MRVARLRGANIRLYPHLELEPSARLNLVCGDNATGKTTLLESIFVLGRGRSFRASRLLELRGCYGPNWSSFAGLESDNGARHGLGVGSDGARVEYRVDGRAAAGVSEAARLFPVQLVEPGGHRLLEDGPVYRRAFVDWGVFHVEHSFLVRWRRFRRALRQRNEALRSGAPAAVVQTWDAELALQAEAVTAYRKAHVDALQPAFSKRAEQLLGLEGAGLELHAGWAAAEPYLDVLRRELKQHQQARTTLQGPHRAELKIKPGHEKIGAWSRGQQKLLIAALVLAQAELMRTCGLESPVLLVDDFGSELSERYQQRLAAALGTYPGQSFVTAFAPPGALCAYPLAMFHVEHGTIARA